VTHPSAEDTVKLVQDLKNRLSMFDNNVKFSHITEPVSNYVPRRTAPLPDLPQNDSPVVSTFITPPSPSSPRPLPRLPKRLSAGTTHWPVHGSKTRAKIYRPPPPIPSDQVDQPPTESAGLTRRSLSPLVRRSAPVSR